MALDEHAAPGACAGYTYQFERALYWLAKSSAGSVVGIETDDDVAIKEIDGSLVLEQDKHSLQIGAKRFGDRSVDLWKTLAIWLDALDSGEVVAETTLFLMVTNVAATDCLARRISCAKTDEQADSCIAELEDLANEPPTSIRTFVQCVLRNDSRCSLRNLLKQCKLIDASEDSAGIALRAKTVAQLPLPEWCSAQSDSIVNELLGWLHKTALTAWQTGVPAWIPRDQYVNQLHAVLDRRTRQARRELAEYLIPVSDDKVGKQRGRPFVRQVHLVTEDSEVVNNAIREYIRCNIEKTRLSVEGNITDEDWKAFETTLQSRWNKIRSRIRRMSKSARDEDVGFEIFTETTESHRAMLAGINTEQVYLTAGTYHLLADMIRVGWHPQFKKLMAKYGEVS